MATLALVLAQLKALEEDLAAVKPFEMVALTEFGLVKGYAAEFGLLRRDVAETLDFCSRIVPEAGVRRAPAPRLSQSRQVSEDRLSDELEALGERVRTARRAIAGAPSDIAAARFDRASAEDKRRLAALAARSGLSAPREPRGDAAPKEVLTLGASAPSRSAPSRSAARAAGERIFVSRRFDGALREQISCVLDAAGYDPIVGRDLDDGGALAECSGGVFSLMPVRREDAGSMTAPVRAGVSEVAVAPPKLRAKALLVGRRSSAFRVPEKLSDLPFFGVKSEVMDDLELERFAAVTSMPTWRPNAEPA